MAKRIKVNVGDVVEVRWSNGHGRSLYRVQDEMPMSDGQRHSLDVLREFESLADGTEVCTYNAEDEVPHLWKTFYEWKKEAKARGYRVHKVSVRKNGDTYYRALSDVEGIIGHYNTGSCRGSLEDRHG